MALSVCLSVCMSVPSNLRGLNSYDDEIWHVGPLGNQKRLRSIRILIFGLEPFFRTQNSFFGLFYLFKD